MDQVIYQLIARDKQRQEALASVQKLDLPQCYVAAGFVRNLVWDHLHHYAVATALNDVDVIYFDANESTPDKCKEYELKLNEFMPQINWEVRNQAVMHIRNGDKPYQSTLDAMRYWPEKETAIAIRKRDSGELECIAAFGFESLFDCQITYNPKRQYDIFQKRVKSKGWLTTWPKLTVAG